MLKAVVVGCIQLILATATLYLIMNLFSTRAKITRARIRRFIIYTFITIAIVYLVMGARTFVEFLLYIGVIIVSFLFEEEKVLDKIWKVILVIAIEITLEMTVNYIGDWIYYNIWPSWIFYQFGVGIMSVIVTGTVTILNKKFKWFKKSKVESIIFSRSEMILLCLLTGCAIFAIIMACTLYEYRDVIEISMVKIMIWAYMTVISTTCVALGVDKNIAQNYYQKVNELIETQFRNQVGYYEKIEEGNKEIRAIKHDMKNHLISMQGLLHSNQLQDLDNYIDDIRTTISKKALLIKTGNTIVDAILNEKNAVAHEKGIAMDIKVGVQEKMGIELIDLCIILSNSIDNAIEACERIEEVDKKKISIKCSYRSGYFFYEITNPMKEETISGIKSRLLTIKKDKKNHGFGVGNIKQSVKKYGGEVKTSAENFEFKLAVEINTKAIVTV